MELPKGPNRNLTCVSLVSLSLRATDDDIHEWAEPCGEGSVLKIKRITHKDGSFRGCVVPVVQTAFHTRTHMGTFCVRLCCVACIHVHVSCVRE